MNRKACILLSLSIIFGLVSCSEDKGYYHDLSLDLGARIKTVAVESKDGLITFVENESPSNAYEKFFNHFNEFEMNNYDFVTYRHSYGKSDVSASGFTCNVVDGVYTKNDLKSSSTKLSTESFISDDIKCSSIELDEANTWVDCTEYEDGIEKANYGTEERYPSSSGLSFYNESELLILNTKPELRFPSDPSAYVFHFESDDGDINETYDLYKYNFIQFEIYKNYIKFSFKSNIGFPPLYLNEGKDNVRHAMILNALDNINNYYCIQELYLNTSTGEIDKVSVKYNGRDYALMYAFNINYEIQLRRNDVDASIEAETLIEKCKSYK